ncbi:MAG: type II toxin-antitoxin system ParD family antitoxin [Pseudomonadota bacterium]
MNIERKVTGPMAAWVDAQIAAGRFATEDDAIQAGLVALADRDAKVQNLQWLIQEGLDAAEAGDVFDYESPEALTADIMQIGRQS